jgi:hypothetical protein
MPPLSKLSKELVSSLLTSQHKAWEATRKEAAAAADEEMGTFVLSDDENENAAQDSKKSKRKAAEDGEKLMRERISKSIDVKFDIDRDMKNLKLSEFDNFCITKK